jgi:hypothetical protein
MPIDVLCVGCQTRFQVSEKFAGKKGPCPKCKAIITVPEKKNEVVIHAPEVSGPKGITGEAVLKPIKRTETKLPIPIAVGIGVAVLATLLIALVLRISSGGTGNVPLPILIFGAILLAPPLALAGYTFLREDELEPYRGMSLGLRLIPPSIVYPALWALYWLIIVTLRLDSGDSQMMLTALVFVIPVVIAAGAFTAQVSLDLTFGNGALHYSLYLVATVILRLIMGMSAYWQGPTSGS